MLMKKITRLMLTLTVLFGLVGGVIDVKASRLYADLSKLTRGPSSEWNTTTNTMFWYQTSNNMISNFDFPAGDYKDYAKIVVNVTNLDNADGIRLQIKANGKEKLVKLVGTGVFEKSLIDDFEFAAADLESFEWARLLGNSWDDSHGAPDQANPASATIEYVYLESPAIVLDVDLDAMAEREGNATWNKNSGVFDWTGTWSNAITLPGLSGNLSAYTIFNIETEKGDCNHFRILIYYSNGAAQTTYKASVGNLSVSFADMGVDPVNLASVASIKISGADDVTGNIKVKSIWLEGPLVNYIEATTPIEKPAGTTALNDLTGTNTSWKCTCPVTVNNETIVCGDGNGDAEGTHVTITDYDYLTFVVTKASADARTGLRIWIWDDVKNEVKTLYPHPEAGCDTVTVWTTQRFITEPGVYVVKVSDYKYLKGIKALQGWNGNAGSIDISLAYASTGNTPVPYVPSGKYTLVGEATGSSSLAAALADENATSYDCTGLTATNLELTAANPNALFVANPGTLSNTQNVIVHKSSTTKVCANLVLTDGHPFKFPFNFSATAASYTTTINAAAASGTLCLPFEYTIPDGVTAWTLSYTSGDECEAMQVETTYVTPDTPVLLNGSGEATFTGANVVVSKNSLKTGALTGVYEPTVVPAGSYVLQDGDSGLGFYKVSQEQPITLNPFRAYLTAETSGSRSLRIVYAGTTGISLNEQAAESKVVYDLQGRRVAQPMKGLYIVNGKKVIK